MKTQKVDKRSVFYLLENLLFYGIIKNNFFERYKLGVFLYKWLVRI